MSARILVVDDLEPNRKLLEAKLTSEYYEVITADSGIRALKIIKDNLPDVILLDVMMPGMDGFETCRQLKNDPVTADIPVVMVTALTDMEDRIQGLNAGADDFLTKPINDLALFARIRSLVRLKNMLDELKLRNKTGASLGVANATTVMKFDVTKARVLIVDDDEAEVQQLSHKLKEAGIKVESVSDPKQAVRRSEEQEFDLIIVSSQVGGGEGMHLCMHFRSQDKTKNTQLLIVVEENNTTQVIQGLDMGISDYLMAPVDSNEVFARVRTQVRRKLYQDALKAQQEESISLAVIDALTGLYNRRYFDIHIGNLLQQGLATNKPLSFMMIDIDFFKHVNDTYGHLAGDEILKQVPERITKNIRANDLAVRYGGEEFAVVMPDTTLEQAVMIGQRIRNAVAAEPFTITPVQVGSGEQAKRVAELKSSVSIGVSLAVHGDTMKTLIKRADDALYAVKKAGRNNVAYFKYQPKGAATG